MVVVVAVRLSPTSAQESATLQTGCNNVTLAAPVGTRIADIALAIAPREALISIFRFDPARGQFLAYAPNVPDSVNDYLALSSNLEPVFICMRAPGSIRLAPSGGTTTATPTGTAGLPAAPTLPPAPATTPGPPPVPPRGVIVAPREVTRPQQVEIRVGTIPGWLCQAGINLPGNPGRRIDVVAEATPLGVAILRFDIERDDRAGEMVVGITCADGLTTVFRILVR